MTARVSSYFTDNLAVFASCVDVSGTRIEIVDRALFPDFAAFLLAAAGPQPR